MGNMKPWAPLQGSEAFQWGGNKMGLRGEIKRAPHLYFFTCCNYPTWYAFYLKGGGEEWKLDLLNKELT